MFYTFALFVISCCCFVGNGVAAADEWSLDCPTGLNIHKIAIEQVNVNELNFFGIDLGCGKDGVIHFGIGPFSMFIGTAL